MAASARGLNDPFEKWIAITAGGEFRPALRTLRSTGLLPGTATKYIMQGKTTLATLKNGL
jgi:hypothetical protein